MVVELVALLVVEDELREVDFDEVVDEVVEELVVEVVFVVVEDA